MAIVEGIIPTPDNVFAVITIIKRILDELPSDRSVTSNLAIVIVQWLNFISRQPKS
jgi:hypothetical protein